MAETNDKGYSPGLAGVIAGETDIACVDQGVLLYRGYAIEQLAEKATFEEVAYLLLFGELPKPDQLKGLKATLDKYRPLEPKLVNALRDIPKGVAMMDVLRSMVSYAGHFDPTKGNDVAAQRERALFLTAQITGIIAARYRFLNGKEPLAPKAGLSHAAQLLYQSKGEVPTDLAAHRTEERHDRHAEEPCFEIPKRRVDGRDRHRRDAWTTKISHRPNHGLPCPGDIHRVSPADNVSKHISDEHRRRRIRIGVTQAAGSSSLYLDEHERRCVPLERSIRFRRRRRHDKGDDVDPFEAWQGFDCHR